MDRLPRRVIQGTRLAENTGRGLEVKGTNDVRIKDRRVIVGYDKVSLANNDIRYSLASDTNGLNAHTMISNGHRHRANIVKTLN